MKRIVITQEWISGIGEQITALQFFLNLIKYIKHIEPAAHITYRFGFGVEAGAGKAIKFGINFDLVKSIADEVEFHYVWHIPPLVGYSSVFQNNEGGYTKLGQNTPFNKSIKIKSEDYDAELCKKIQIHIDTFAHHVTFNITALPFKKEDNCQIEVFDVLSDTIKSIAEKYCDAHRLYDFTVLHLREDTSSLRQFPRIGIYADVQEDTLFYAKLKSRFDALTEADSNKLYFLATNNKYLKTMYKDVKNVYTIQRDIVEEWDEIKSLDQLSAIELSDCFAFIELAIILRSDRIIHSMDCRRDLISLFLWQPLFFNNTPVIWVTCGGGDVQLTYNPCGCIEQNTTFFK